MRRIHKNLMIESHMKESLMKESLMRENKTIGRINLISIKSSMKMRIKEEGLKGDDLVKKMRDRILRDQPETINKKKYRTIEENIKTGRIKDSRIDHTDRNRGAHTEGKNRTRANMSKEADQEAAPTMVNKEIQMKGLRKESLIKTMRRHKTQK